MFARTKAQHGVLKVSNMRSGDIHDVNVWVAGQFSVTGIDMVDGMVLSKGLGTRLAARAHGEQCGISDLSQRFGKGPGNGAGAKNSPSDGPIDWLHVNGS
jgi:hypothetical protein